MSEGDGSGGDGAGGGGAWLRACTLVVLLAVLALAVFTWRVVSEGNRELGLSDAAFDGGDLQGAVEHARHAAVLFAPGAPHVAAAYERLRAIAVGAEASARTELARQAWEAIREACIESSSALYPSGARLVEANRNLARLELGPGAAERDRGGVQRHLAGASPVRMGWVLVLGLGLGLVAAALALFAARGLEDTGRVSRRVALLCAAMAVLGVACWTLAVVRA